MDDREKQILGQGVLEYERLTGKKFREDAMGISVTKDMIEGETTGLQVGGDHYEKMKIQPAQFARANDYDSDAFSILKYLMRHRAKDGLEGVEKARSFVKIRVHNNKHYSTYKPRQHDISAERMIAENGHDKLTAKAILILHAWVMSAHDDGPLATLLTDAIDDLISAYKSE